MRRGFNSIIILLALIQETVLIVNALFYRHFYSFRRSPLPSFFQYTALAKTIVISSSPSSSLSSSKSQQQHQQQQHQQQQQQEEPNNMNPATTTEQIIQSYYNAETAKSYNAMMPEEMPKVEIDLNYLLKHLQKLQQQQQKQQQEEEDSENAIVLDLCCGTGDMLLWLYDAWDHKHEINNKDENNNNNNNNTKRKPLAWKGNDLSTEMLKIAKEKLGPERNVQFYQGSMEQLDLTNMMIQTDHSCAAVLCNFAIHHLQDYMPVLQEATRVLILRPKDENNNNNDDDDDDDDNMQVGGMLYLSFWEGKGQMEEENGIPMYYHDPEKIKEALIQLGYKIEQARSAKEEIGPDFSMNATYILASMG